MPRPHLKPIEDQVIVLTGATSGIGLVTARLAAQRGARLVLAARSEGALRDLTEQLESEGCEVTHCVTDVGRRDDVRRLAEAALEDFGGFDTWINNAGVIVYGESERVPIEDSRRLFDTNFWGTVYGSLEAVSWMKEHGGAVLNIGSVVADRSLPLQGMYGASKAAVRGFTEALRMEMEAAGLPVVVTHIKPSGIDTPYTVRAASYMDTEPRNPSPLYAPEVAAEAILFCARHARREVTVGLGGRVMGLMSAVSPGFTDRMLERVTIPAQKSDRPPRDRGEQGLFHPAGDGEERGPYERKVLERSYYTDLALRPGLVAGAGALALGAAVLGVGACCGRKREG